MTFFDEKDLRLEIKINNVEILKFDDEQEHGLTHCMKAVDFIIEEQEKVVFVEFKDPDNPQTPAKEKKRFKKKLDEGLIDDDLIYKFRDTFIYRWAQDKLDKPIFYYVLIALDSLDDALLVTRTDELKRRLPLDSYPASWKRPLAQECIVFNLTSWNNTLKHYPIKRISAG